jgi:prolyl oligopeptidase
VARLPAGGGYRHARIGLVAAAGYRPLAENTSSTLLNIINEVDRYIAWPGQALAYKIGELKIRELRMKAETNLGEKFNLREFHDLILQPGALPLDVLEGKVEDYLAMSLQL